MHPCLNVDEILRQLARELVVSGGKATAVSLACCCKGFEDPVLDVLWESQDQLFPLLKTLPTDAWKAEAGHFVSLLQEVVVFPSNRMKSFERIPAKAEWIRFRKYAREMRKLSVDTTQGPLITSDILLILQLRTANDPLLPKLKTFECYAVEVFIPFIPLFLSCEITRVVIRFAQGLPALMVASMIVRLPMICPDLECITLHPLPGDLVINEAVSEMLLTCNRNTLQMFRVVSPLTEEARQVVLQLPRLFDLCMVIPGHALLPSVALPNLRMLYLEYDDHLGWLQGFRGGILNKLQAIYLRSRSEEVGDILGEFKSVALTTTIPVTLSVFSFITSRPWDPSYRSLLPFTQLTTLVILFSCEDHCSSRVDDDIIMDLARAMPKLEILQLGNAPCKIGGGVTVKGLIALARGCRLLSELRIHFETASFLEAAAGAEVSTPPNGGAAYPRWDCALTNLEVGKIPIPALEGTVLKVSMTLLRIFPRFLHVQFIEKKWKEVVKTIKLFRRIDTFVQHTGDALGIGAPRE